MHQTLSELFIFSSFRDRSCAKVIEQQSLQDRAISTSHEARPSFSGSARSILLAPCLEDEDYRQECRPSVEQDRQLGNRLLHAGGARPLATSSESSTGVGCAAMLVTSATSGSIGSKVSRYRSGAPPISSGLCSSFEDFASSGAVSGSIASITSIVLVLRNR